MEATSCFTPEITQIIEILRTKSSPHSKELETFLHNFLLQSNVPLADAIVTLSNMLSTYLLIANVVPTTGLSVQQSTKIH